MNRFLSNWTNKIDAKGRVSVPAEFRTVLASLGSGPYYAWRDFADPAISVAGPGVLDRFEKMIASEDPFSARARRMSLLIHGGGVFLKFDQEGRLPVSDLMRSVTGIADRVTFVGRGDYFQIWEPSAYEAAEEAARKEWAAGI